MSDDVTETPIYDQLVQETDTDIEATLERDCTYDTWKREFDASWPARWEAAQAEAEAEAEAKPKKRPRKSAAGKPAGDKLPTEEFRGE